MTKHLAGVLRTIATVAVNLAERLDPQPDITGVWPFEIHTPTGTRTAEAHITWHATG